MGIITNQQDPKAQDRRAAEIAYVLWRARRTQELTETFSQLPPAESRPPQPKAPLDWNTPWYPPAI